jgi:transposase-like protein
MVAHESIRRWCLKFGSEFAARLRRRRPRPGDTWHLDEVLILSANAKPEAAYARSGTIRVCEKWRGALDG